MHVLLTGGAGYIGTHTAVEFINAGHTVTIVDNLSNSSVKAVRRVERLTNSSIDFHEVDLLETVPLDQIFRTSHFDAVVHFAGLKAVGESVSKPLDYYRNNISGTIIKSDNNLDKFCWCGPVRSTNPLPARTSLTAVRADTNAP